MLISRKSFFPILIAKFLPFLMIFQSSEINRWVIVHNISVKEALIQVDMAYVVQGVLNYWHFWLSGSNLPVTLIFGNNSITMIFPGKTQ